MAVSDVSSSGRRARAFASIWSEARRGTPATRSARPSRATVTTPNCSTGARWRTRAPARRTRRTRCSTARRRSRRRRRERLAEILSLRGRLWKDGVHRARDAGTSPRWPNARAANTSPPTRCSTIPIRASTRRRCRCCSAIGAAARRLAQAILARLDGATTPHVLGSRHGRRGAPSARATRRRPNALRGRHARRARQRRQRRDDAPAGAAAGARAARSRRRPGPAARTRRAGVRRPHGRRTRSGDAALSRGTRTRGRRRDPRSSRAPSRADRLHVGRVRRRPDRHRGGARSSAPRSTSLLPFDRDDFVRTSVAVGGDGWLARFDAALARATRVIPATAGEPPRRRRAVRARGDAGRGPRGAARGAARDHALLLCVIDAAAAGRVGGTRSARSSAGKRASVRRT